MDREESQERLEIDTSVLSAKDLPDTLVLLEDVGGQDQPDASVPLRVEDPPRDAAEEAPETKMFVLRTIFTKRREPLRRPA